MGYFMIEGICEKKGVWIYKLSVLLRLGISYQFPNKLTNLSEGRKMSDSDSSVETWYFVKKSVKIKMYIV